ncbi:MAG: hypothetical protein ACOY33_06640 [Pseudomonadota bacterium]
MYRPTLLLACALAVPGAHAAVVELDGDAMVDTYVQGISIGQVVTDKEFDSDDQQLRDAAVDRQNAQGSIAPEIAVSNADALRQTAQLDDLVPQTLASIEDDTVRDLAEDALVETQIVRQNLLGDRIDVNYNKLAEFGIAGPTPQTDTSALRGSLLELLPSATGYQFELMK